MRRLLLIAVSLLAHAMIASGADAVADNEGVTRVAALIEQLAAHSYDQREAASKRLIQIGESALPQLRQAAGRDLDAEVRWRARRIFRNIMHDASISKSTGMQLVFLYGDEFEMGSEGRESGRKDDEKQHAVEVSRAYLLGAYEVTQAEYHLIMDAAPSQFLPKDEPIEESLKTFGKHPVDSVSWFDACLFCNRMSERDGLAPYYQIEDIKKQDASIQFAKVTVLGGIGYRLPTEAEWEYACRASSVGPFGAVVKRTSAYGNYKRRVSTGYGTVTRSASKNKTIAVGAYPPNLLGFHDMHGNVAEWCSDWYDKTYYDKSPAANPTGPKTGHHRVIRGGSWLVAEANCRCAARFWQTPGEGKYFIGFRIARTASKYMTSQP
ncbi:MAG: SUMF1/EgtB/PvdO family nonheme iron enzyme [bacterium]|nr:SUMF1/EgtB/PvdO family nonheme iron enzyme [bacterium]